MEMRFICARFAEDAATAMVNPRFFEAVQFYRAFADFANPQSLHRELLPADCAAVLD